MSGHGSFAYSGGGIENKIDNFVNRPLEGDWPHVWLDAIYLKLPDASHIVSVAGTLAIAVNTDGRHEVLRLSIGASEAKTP